MKRGEDWRKGGAEGSEEKVGREVWKKRREGGWIGKERERERERTEEALGGRRVDRIRTRVLIRSTGTACNGR